MKQIAFISFLWLLGHSIGFSQTADPANTSYLVQTKSYSNGSVKSKMVYRKETGTGRLPIFSKVYRKNGSVKEAVEYGLGVYGVYSTSDTIWRKNGHLKTVLHFEQIDSTKANYSTQQFYRNGRLHTLSTGLASACEHKTYSRKGTLQIHVLENKNKVLFIPRDLRKLKHYTPSEAEGIEDKKAFEIAGKKVVLKQNQIGRLYIHDISNDSLISIDGFRNGKLLYSRLNYYDGDGRNTLMLVSRDSVAISELDSMLVYPKHMNTRYALRILSKGAALFLPLVGLVTLPLTSGLAGVYSLTALVYYGSGATVFAIDKAIPHKLQPVMVRFRDGKK